MENVKEVSDPIAFVNMKRKYYNIFSRVKNEKQKELNEKSRSELIFEMSTFLKLKPMFSKLEIFNFKKYEIDINDNCLYDCDLILYLDSSDNIIHQELEIHQEYDKNENYLKEQKIDLNEENCELKNGKIVKKNSKKDGYKELFKFKEGIIGAFTSIASIIACLISSGFFGIGFIPSALLISKSYSDYRDEQRDKNEKINNLLKEKKIAELITLK